MKKALIYHLFVILALGGADTLYGMLPRALHRSSTALRTVPRTHAPVQPTSPSWTWKSLLSGPNRTKRQVLNEAETFLEQFKKGESEGVESFSNFLIDNDQAEVNIILNEVVSSEAGFDALAIYIRMKITIGAEGSSAIIKKIIKWTKTGKFKRLTDDQQKQLLKLLNQNSPGIATTLANIFRIISKEFMKQLKSTQTKEDDKPINKE